jgi:benzoyl-CoA-dihydrodiol lyase
MLSELNFGTYPTVAQKGRIEARFYGEKESIVPLRENIGVSLASEQAFALGLVTAIPDELDWNEEVRLAIEERTSLSPDALTGMEASLRFGPGETMETRIFGRLTAWQNWIFIRPNAVGEAGALKVFGTGNKAKFNWDRI